MKNNKTIKILILINDHLLVAGEEDKYSNLSLQHADNKAIEPNIMDHIAHGILFSYVLASKMKNINKLFCAV